MAFELSSLGVDTLVVERARGPASGASGANSGIIHTGFDSAAGSFESQMVLAHGQRWRRVFEELGVVNKICGALVLALTFSDAARLVDIAANAARNGVKIKQLDRGQVRNLEPQVRAQAGILIPEEAITDPFQVVERLLDTAGGVRYGVRVQRVELYGEGVVLHTSDGPITARFAINCAGLFADDIAGDASFSISPRRGEFAVYPRDAAQMTDHILLPVPRPQTKGILVFPTVHDHLCAGPTAVDQTDKHDSRVRPEALTAVRQGAAKLLPRLANFEPVDSWAGLRTVGHPHNYIVEWSKRVPGLFHVAGIRSTGLSACLGLSAFVTERLRERGLRTGSRRSFAKSPAIAARPWWQRRTF